jgi:hypothetical protein
VQVWSPLGAIQGLIDTRTEYDHLFSIYVPIATGVFALIVVLVLASGRPSERPSSAGS